MDAIEAKDAVPGQWYTKHDHLIIAIRHFPDFGDAVFANGDGEMVSLARDEKVTPVPECTGWDWVPPKTAEDYLREHNASGLTVGDRVRISRGFEFEEGGVGLSFRAEMRNHLGADGVIVADQQSSGFDVEVGDVVWGWPSFCLKKLHVPIPKGWRKIDPEKDGPKRGTDKFWGAGGEGWLEVAPASGEHYTGAFLPRYQYIRRIEPEYRPFANAAEFRPHRERWWRFKRDSDCQSRPPDLYRDTGHFGTSWSESFSYKVFEDGSPFGVEVTE